MCVMAGWQWMIFMKYLSTLQIIINDCVPVMKDFIKKGNAFDYIIHDTTDIPINTTLAGMDIPFLLLAVKMVIIFHQIAYGDYYTLYWILHWSCCPRLVVVLFKWVSAQTVWVWLINCLQGHGSCDHSAQKMFQHHLTNLHSAVDYSTVSVPVPSFKEEYPFGVWSVF